MLKSIAIAAIIALVITARATPSSAKTTIAFGYIHNQSGDAGLNYLETVFSNSFGTSLSVHGYAVKKPLMVNEHLKKTYGVSLGKDYADYELPELLEKINADILVYGWFKTGKDNTITITMRLYYRGAREVYTFTNVGSLEAEMFNLVDKIAIAVKELLEKHRFKTQRIPAQSRIGIISNIQGMQINRLYAEIMNKDYRIACLNANDPALMFTDQDYARFAHITTRENSFSIISDWTKIRFHYGSYTGKRYRDHAARIKTMYQKYDRDYTAEKIKTLDRLVKTFRGNIDYLLIVVFSPGKDEAMVRCIDVKKHDLIWLQSGIRGGSKNSVGDISSAIAAMMPRLFREK